MEYSRNLLSLSPPRSGISITYEPAVPRRIFFQLCPALGAWLSAPMPPAKESPQAGRNAVKNRKNFVAIQMKPHTWLDQGIEQWLDNLQQKDNVNYTCDLEMGPRNTPNGVIPLPGTANMPTPGFRAARSTTTTASTSAAPC
jgi:hypothetical protein